jgi:putative flippase GtrA
VRTAVYNAVERIVPASLRRLVRFAMAGTAVMVVNLATTTLLIALDVPVQATVAIAYLTSLVTHFTLQRTFVFAGQGQFALTLGQQMRRYAALAAVQYPTTAALAAIGVAIGLPDLAAAISATILMTPATYFLLRTRMFHAAAGDEV